MTELAGNGGGAVIKSRGLCRRFGDLLAVDGVDLDVERGEVFGFLGPNGAGKSTLIRMLVGLLSPSAGSVEVLGLAMPEGAEQLRHRLGYMPQRFALYRDLSVAENLEFAASVFGFGGAERRRRVARTLEEYGLDARRQQRPATLSGGWRQRLALAAATIHEPQLLFLDEPTAGVDPENRRRFWGKIFELAAAGTTVLVSTHYMDEAVRCHRLCLVRHGQRAALGAPRALTDALHGRVVSIVAQPINDAIDHLQASEQVASVTQLGNRIHVLLRPGAPDAAGASAQLKALLERAGLAAEARIAEPSLEDVFVALIGGEDLGGGNGDRR